MSHGIRIRERNSATRLQFSSAFVGSLSSYSSTSCRLGSIFNAELFPFNFADVLRAGPEEGAAAPDSCRQDNRCHCPDHVPHCLRHFPDLLLHPLQGLLIGAGAAAAQQQQRNVLVEEEQRNNGPAIID